MILKQISQFAFFFFFPYTSSFGFFFISEYFLTCKQGYDQSDQYSLCHDFWLVLPHVVSHLHYKHWDRIIMLCTSLCWSALWFRAAFICVYNLLDCAGTLSWLRHSFLFSPGWTEQAYADVFLRNYSYNVIYLSQPFYAGQDSSISIAHFDNTPWIGYHTHLPNSRGGFRVVCPSIGMYLEGRQKPENLKESHVEIHSLSLELN